MEVVGSDGEHVGTVDKVRGDRILLTKNDADAGGRHHSIPSSWMQTVDDKVTLSKSADEAKEAWRDEERNQALFGDDDDGTRREPYASGRSSRDAARRRTARDRPRRRSDQQHRHRHDRTDGGKTLNKELLGHLLSADRRCQREGPGHRPGPFCVAIARVFAIPVDTDNRGE